MTKTSLQGLFHVGHEFSSVVWGSGSRADAAECDLGAGDFNGTRTDDVLLQNGGTLVDWIMKNGQYQIGNVITTDATGFSIVGSGDYNWRWHKRGTASK
jgi:hypothetical protein